MELQLHTYTHTRTHPKVSLVSHLFLNVTHFLNCIGYVVLDGRTDEKDKMNSMRKEVLP
jgi:hypothetical protein